MYLTAIKKNEIEPYMLMSEGVHKEERQEMCGAGSSGRLVLGSSRMASLSLSHITMSFWN